MRAIDPGGDEACGHGWRSFWREAPLVATARRFAVGSMFSSPLVVDGTVFFGSADGNLYALE